MFVISPSYPHGDAKKNDHGPLWPNHLITVRRVPKRVWKKHRWSGKGMAWENPSGNPRIIWGSKFEGVYDGICIEQYRPIHGNGEPWSFLEFKTILKFLTYLCLVVWLIPFFISGYHQNTLVASGKGIQSTSVIGCLCQNWASAAD